MDRGAGRASEMKRCIFTIVVLAGLVAFGKDFIQQPVLGQVHASTFLVLTNGGYVAAWFGGSKEGAGDVAIWGACKQGGAWELPRVFAKVNRDSPHWNPVLRRGDDGRICLYFKVGRNCADWRTYLVESCDEGRTWSDPKELIPGECRGGRGPVRNKCIRLKSGRWLAPASREIGRWRAFVDRSDDDGRTWTASDEIGMSSDDPKVGVIQPSLWVGHDGMVHAFMRSNAGKVWESHSFDEGETWSMARPTEIPNNNSGIDLVKTAEGDIFLALNPISGNWASRAKLEIWRSVDDGWSWKTFRVLENEPRGEFSYPCIRETNQGVIAVSYTWNRKRIAFAEFPFGVDDPK